MTWPSSGHIVQLLIRVGRHFALTARLGSQERKLNDTPFKGENKQPPSNQSKCCAMNTSDLRLVALKLGQDAANEANAEVCWEGCSTQGFHTQVECLRMCKYSCRSIIPSSSRSAPLIMSWISSSGSLIFSLRTLLFNLSKLIVCTFG